MAAGHRFATCLHWLLEKRHKAASVVSPAIGCRGRHVPTRLASRPRTRAAGTSHDLDERLALGQLVNDDGQAEPEPRQQVASAGVADANPDDRRPSTDARPTFGEVLVLG